MLNTNIAVVTSFNNLYPLKDLFLTSFFKYWPSYIDIIVFSEDYLLLSNRVKTYYLNNDKDYVEFYSTLNVKEPYVYDYKLDIKRFSHKVFAITSNILRCYNWLIWLDSDVETIDYIDNSFLTHILNPYYTIVYLGRTGWSHSECGFVSYNLKKGADQFLDRFRNIYVTKEILSFPELHDSYVFDRLRKCYSNEQFLNLSKHSNIRDVWPETILASKMIHHIGEQKFNKPYYQNPNIKIKRLNIKI
jgi:hypothetical protein